MLRLCARAGPIFENEPRCLFIQSPVYVFGDIHGNLEVWRGVGAGSGKNVVIRDLAAEAQDVGTPGSVGVSLKYSALCSTAVELAP